MYSDELRPAISEPMKRAVRQRFRFGCAVCGSPVFDYDHIIPFSEVHKHEADNLLLLCPNHHSAKTRSRLSEARLLYYRDTPYNADRAFSSAYDLDKTAEISIIVGSNTLNWEPGSTDATCEVVWISGQSHFALQKEDGWLTFSMLVTDERGSELLHIDRGQMRVSSKVWDFEYVGSRLKVREGLRKVILDVEIANDRVILHTACFVSGGLGWRVEGGWMYSVGSEGVLASVGGTAHLSGSGGGMYGMTNQAVLRQLIGPSFTWHRRLNVPQPGYIWFSEESLERFRVGEIGLKSLEQHWAGQAGADPLSGTLEATARARYFVELTTNERFMGPSGSTCLVIEEIKPFFNAIAAALPDTAVISAETVAYVPADVLPDHRASSYGTFVESDSRSHERTVRLVAHLPNHDDERFFVRSEEIVRMLARGDSRT